MQNTKKVKHAGRFGSRYGKGIRDRIVAVEKIQRKKHECPRCGFKRVKRISTGLYKCSKCGFTFTGGAFAPTTMSGRIVKKMVSQRKFLPLVKDLIEAREEQLKGTVKKKLEKEEESKKKGKSKVSEKVSEDSKKATKEKPTKKGVKPEKKATGSAENKQGSVEPKAVPETGQLITLAETESRLDSVEPKTPAYMKG